MARQPAGPARQRNADLIRELDRIARQKELTVHGRVDYRALSLRSGMSESGLDGIVKRNSVPDALTLVRVARFAAESPLWLFLAAHWITIEDVDRFEAERDARLIPRAIQEEQVTPEELAAARRLVEGLLAQLALLEGTHSAPPDAEPSPPPRIPPPGREGS